MFCGDSRYVSHMHNFWRNQYTWRWRDCILKVVLEIFVLSVKLLLWCGCGLPWAVTGTVYRQLELYFAKLDAVRHLFGPITTPPLSSPVSRMQSSVSVYRRQWSADCYVECLCVQSLVIRCKILMLYTIIKPNVHKFFSISVSILVLWNISCLEAVSASCP